jgi:hypothetical protein
MPTRKPTRPAASVKKTPPKSKARSKVKVADKAKKPQAKAKKPQAKAKKPQAAAKPAVVRTPVDPSAVPLEEPPLTTFSHILSELGAPDAALRSALAALQTDAERVAAGKNVRSSKVLQDGARITGAAFHGFRRSGPEVRVALQAAGLTEALVAVTAAELAALERLSQHAAQQGYAGATLRGKVRSQASAAEQMAVGLRDAAWNVLGFIARADVRLKSRLDAVTPIEEGRTSLAAQLDQLADLADQALANRAGAVGALIRLRGLTAEAPQQWRRAAAGLRESDQATRSLPADDKTAQAEMDRLDGLCLFLLRELDRGMVLARRSAPALLLPRLYALRSFLRRGSGADKKDPAPGPAPDAP